MAKELATRGKQEVGPPADLNWAEEYGSEAFQSNIVGTLLKFNKGEWLAGKEEEEVPIGTEFVVAAHLLQSGWMRWEDSAPVEILMGLRSEGFRPAPRETLGYTNKDEWGELNGQKIDPWRRADLLLMADPENGDIYTYSPMSDGGLSAVKMMIKEYGANIRVKPNDIPVVKLGSEWYKHPTYGKIYKPVLEIVDWRDMNDMSFTPVDEEENEAQEAKSAAKPARASAQKPAPRAAPKKSNGKRR
jgi:hypothetical protein